MAPKSSRRELEELRRLVLEASEVILAQVRAVHELDPKAGTEFVTETDRRSEELVLAGLARLFPGEPVMAEESGDHAGRGERTWYVDPLDGTTNFAHGYPFFCVSVGARDAAGMQLAAVCAPALGECYLAGRGLGASVLLTATGRESPLGQLKPVSLDRALLATGFPYVRDELVARNTELVRSFLQAPCHGVRRAGSAALDLCHVAAGRLDGYWEFRLRPWDTAAGILVARECGAIVTEADGTAQEHPYRSILAAAPDLHGQMARVINAAGSP